MGAGVSGRSNGIAGFTLLEVMMAVAILGLALTAILSSQVGLFASADASRNITQAIGFARCRMSELEEQMLKFNFPEVDTTDDGACCTDEETPVYKCAWRIERIELPQATTSNPAGSASSIAGVGGPPGTSPSLPNPAGASSSLGPLGALANASNLPAGGGISGLSGALAGAASGGTSAIAPLVMGFVYPSLKLMLESSIRKLTVKVLWREGINARELELVQWLTNPTRGGLLAAPIGSDSIPGLVPGGAATGAATTTTGSGMSPTTGIRGK